MLTFRGFGRVSNSQNRDFLTRLAAQYTMLWFIEAVLNMASTGTQYEETIYDLISLFYPLRSESLTATPIPFQFPSGNGYCTRHHCTVVVMGSASGPFTRSTLYFPYTSFVVHTVGLHHLSGAPFSRVVERPAKRSFSLQKILFYETSALYCEN